jgi:hypothetical protein
MIITISIIFATLLYFTNILSYVVGVRHGRTVKDNGVPQINPIKARTEHKQHKQEKQKNDLQREGLENILNFGEPFR